ncbi:DUF2142 domain-containing protein [Bradyrhizobium hipponense]|uniref:DUF2142 domain-containing protein n=1 Tax=Bradyrhizobium hipponense TaxID=2605638 RepID=A0A5S4YY72_9BRAD|nr:DUF2142 domain-containing protein [Bradyrhizobium hipponense]TYO68556.1 DUF2142 domain-containing protein [Bradyrhizobium hipponense]
MLQPAKPDAAPSAVSRIGRRFGRWPAIVFTLFSLFFGSAIIVVNPPLRGPDEISHFLRIYSYTRGEFLPVTEINGRKGIFVERGLYERLHFFKDRGGRFASLQQHKGDWFARYRDKGVRYGQVMTEYHDIIGARDDEAEQAPVFVPFAGTEGYNPVAYAPYILAAAVGRLLSLDLPELLFLMRFFGLVVFTAVTAYAVAVTPTLQWAFVLIAMLPVSLYNRVVLSADGAALSYALVITALCFRAAWNPSEGRIWERSLWMTVCVLAKQPQIIFVLLELMSGRLGELLGRWKSIAMVVLPGVILSPLWVVGVSADVAAWRVREGHDYPAEQFDPLWKLAYMWEHPFHFPLATWTALREWGAPLWPEFIGILGWQDIVLRPWTYIVLTALLLLVPLQQLPLDGTRARVAIVTGFAVLSYLVLVYLIFFLTYTPITSPHVLGVQGRYFVIALPMAAIFMASLINLELPRGVPALVAITGSMIAGVMSVDGVLKAHW